MIGRLDPNFYKPSHRALDHKLINSEFHARTVRDVSRRVVDGPFGTQLKVEDYQEEGIPVIRVSNVRTGEISEENLIRISPEKHRELKRSRVLPNDVVLTKAGAILGYSAVFPAHLQEGNITSHLVTITCEPEINPSFLKYIFQSNIGQRQIYRWGNKSTRPELNTQEVKRILVPVPPPAIQARVVSIMDDARARKKVKEAEAQALLNGIDDYLLGELGIQMPPFELSSLANRIFNSNSLALTSARFDPHFHHPDFNKLVQSIKDTAHELLGQLVTFSHETWDRKAEKRKVFDYIEISGVDLQTGEISATETFVSEAPSRAQMIVRANDILVSLTRPHRGAIAVVNASLDSCIASTGFAVLRQLQTPNLDREFLWNILRSKICLRQMLQRSSGGNYPAITEAELRRIVLPMPSLKVQSKIVVEVRQRQVKAKQLRGEGAQEVERAKQEIERIILGEQA